MPITNKITRKYNHKRRYYQNKTKKSKHTLKKPTNSKPAVVGGGFFDFFTRPKTKFAYMMANSAYKYAMESSSESKDYTTSDYDEKTKHLIMKAFRKIFVRYMDDYKNNTEIRVDSNKKSLNLILDSVKEYKKIGEYNYDIVKYKSSMQYGSYVKKLLDDYIKEFVNYLKKNTDNSRNYYDSSSTSIRAPDSTKSSSEPFATINFYDRNKTPTKVPNILYRISRPQIASDNKHELKTRIKKQHSTADDFVNSYSQYVTAFNVYVKYRVEKQ